MKLCWLFGHKKRYVGIRDQEKGDPQRLMRFKDKCVHGYWYYDHCGQCMDTVQVAMWVCDRRGCIGMGTTPIKNGTGLFAVHFGALVPDEKRWSNS